MSASENESSPLFEEQLRDLNAIIIGNTQSAEELLVRRVEAGGRALLFWCDIASCEVVPLSQEQAGYPDFEKMAWMPPSPDKRAHDQYVAHLRRKFGSQMRAGCKLGPDIVDLLPDERAELLQDSRGNLCGARVIDDAGNVLWHISGLVIPSSADRPVDMTVRDPDMMPFVVMSYRGLLAACLWCLFIYTVNIVSMMRNDVGSASSGIHWHRGNLFLIGLSGNVLCMLGEALTGIEVTIVSRGGCIFLTALTQFCASIVSLGHYSFSFFMSCYVTVTVIVCAVLPAYIVWPERTCRISPATDSASSHRESVCAESHSDSGLTWNRASLAWTVWLLSGSFGTCNIFYGIAMIYLALNRDMPFLSAVALPCMAAICDKGVIYLNNKFYEYLVSAPRRRSRSIQSKQAGRCVPGDQHQFITFTMQITFSFKEATMLIALIAGEARAPSSTWPASLFVSFVASLIERLYLLSQWLPQMIPHAGLSTWMGQKLRPNVSTHLHNQVRCTMGYPRFVLVVAYMCARGAILGTETPLLFNSSCMGVLLGAFGFEVLEDAIVFMCYSPWFAKRLNWAPLAAARQFSQAFICGGEASYSLRAEIGFHGVREHKLLDMVTLVHPAESMAWSLLTLLLGIGYIISACERPLPLGAEQLLDGLYWQDPLLCADS